MILVSGYPGRFRLTAVESGADAEGTEEKAEIRGIDDSVAIEVGDGP